MAKRSILAKKANKLRKAMRNTPKQYLDPVRWLIDHGHARTKREATALILAKRLRADSHKVGFEEVMERTVTGEPKKVLRVCGVPVEYRPRLLVASE